MIGFGMMVGAYIYKSFHKCPKEGDLEKLISKEDPIINQKYINKYS